MTANTARIPGDLKRSGRKLWIALNSEYDLSEPELLLLHQASRIADVCDELVKVIAREGVMGAGGYPHPAVKELRAQAQALAVVLRDLAIPPD